MRWLVGLKQLQELGILGMNCRNIDFIGRYNRRSLYQLVDDKLRTKELAKRHGIPMPRLLFTLKEQHRVKHIGNLLESMSEFVIKPCKGSGGKGILVIGGREGEFFVKSSGAKLTLQDIQRHMSNILAGLHSLAGTPDTVMIEERIELDGRFEGYSYQGIPDLRVIVFQGYPVMAMLRLATRDSDGKANLHQGAVGVGLDLATGQCLNAVQRTLPLQRHPDTGKAFTDIEVPNWRELLVLTSRCYEMTGLGYLGTDIILDRQRGPLLLELNARPGLSIQVACGFGLLPRLRRVESLRKKHACAEDRVAYALSVLGAMNGKHATEMAP